MKRLFLTAALVCVSALSWCPGVRAQQWTLISPPRPGWAWYSVACSADGSTIIAGDSGGGIYASTDFGISGTVNTNMWPTFSDVDIPYPLVSSADCTTCYVLASGDLFVSTDFGGYWNELAGRVYTVTGQSLASAVHLSADGETVMLAAGDPFGNQTHSIILSTNSGANFVVTSAPVINYAALACSADGTKLVALTRFFSMYTSTNSGRSWASNSLPVQPGYPGYSIAGSADLSSLLVPAGQSIAITTNLGVDWKVIPSPNVDVIASSADGIRLIAGASSGASVPGNPIYTSADGGFTWTSNSVSAVWTALASSADGHRLVAAGDSGLWTFQSVPAPVLQVSTPPGSIIVSWIIPSMNFVLQQSPDFNSPDWTDVTTPPTTNYSSLTYEVNLPRPAGTMFYRLVSR